MSVKRSLFGVLAAMALLAGVPSASAGDERVTAAPKLHCLGNDHGAYACFQPEGDKVWVKDTTLNGLSAAAAWETDYGRRGVCVNSNGKDSWFTCDYNMREGAKLTFRPVDLDKPTNTYLNWGQPREVTI